MLFTIPQEAFPAASIPLQTGAAGATGASISMKNALRAWVKFVVTQGNAATVALSINQGINVAFGSSKALISTVPIWLNDTANTQSIFARQTDAINFTTDATLATKIVIFQLDPNKLDVNNGFNTIQPVIGASNAANIIGCEVWFMPRYQGDTNPVNVFLD
jgi:hypothetical protein